MARTAFLACDPEAPRDSVWIATEHGIDLDVPTGRGATPSEAVMDLLWHLDDEDTDPATLDIRMES